MLAALVAAAPAAAKVPVPNVPDYPAVWRYVITTLAAYAKKRDPSFLVLVRGGPGLMVKSRWEARRDRARDPDGLHRARHRPVGAIYRSYVRSLDGLTVNGLYCGIDRITRPLTQAVAAMKARDAKLAKDHDYGILPPPAAIPDGPFSIDPQVELKRAAEIRKQAERDRHVHRALTGIEAMRGRGRAVLSIDDCATAAMAAAAQRDGDRDHVLTFAATDDSRLDRLPDRYPDHENAAPVATLGQARNWLPMINGDRYQTTDQWLKDVGRTNYDVVVVGVMHRGKATVTKAEIAALKYKHLGAPRLVLADMPVGLAFDNQWYWKKEWHVGDPAFLAAVDSNRPDAYIVDMSNPAWRAILGKYIAGIMDLGFDGVVFDDVDTYGWYERRTPLTGY